MVLKLAELYERGGRAIVFVWFRFASDLVTNIWLYRGNIAGRLDSTETDLLLDCDEEQGLGVLGIHRTPS